MAAARVRETWPALALAAVVLVLALAGDSGHPPSASGQVPTPSPVPAPGPPGPQVRLTYPAGWNLVSVPNGGALPSSPRAVYTYQGTAYQTVDGSSTQPGIGYWIYFDQITPVTYPGGGPDTFTRTLPAGQWVMVGNPRSTLVLVSGADVLYTYDTTVGYQSATVLQPGQGAWAFSFAGGPITFTNLTP